MSRSFVFLTFALATLVSSECFADGGGYWNGKKAAVVLTYDDSLNVHLDTVVPALDARGFKGTFYITVNPEAFSSRVPEWKKAAASGHELGNHTLFHPCSANKPGRDWVSADYDLDKYSVKRMVEEIALTNRILESVDGLNERTYAYTCGDTYAGKSSFVEEIKPYFVGARGVANNFTKPGENDLFNINSFFVFEHNGRDLIAMTNKAIKDGSMIVYLFHGVGGEHSLNVSAEAHTQLLDFLKENQKQV